MSETDESDRERLAAIAAFRQRYDEDAAPVIEELRAAGFEVEGVGDLYGRKLDYRDAIPILVTWLPRVANPIVKEDIVRALSVKWAKNTSAASLLVAEFEQADDATGTGLRWAIGNALEVLANDDVADGMINIATNRGYGTARQMVVVGLGRLKNPRVVDVLIDLLDDEDVTGHAVMALGKLRAKAARSRIEPLLNHPKSWIRKEAKKSLARIDKAA